MTIISRNPDSLATSVETAEVDLLRAAKVVDAVTAACEARGIALPQAVTAADVRLRRALERWMDAVRRLEETIGP